MEKRQSEQQTTVTYRETTCVCCATLFVLTVVVGKWAGNLDRPCLQASKMYLCSECTVGAKLLKVQCGLRLSLQFPAPIGETQPKESRAVGRLVRLFSAPGNCESHSLSAQSAAGGGCCLRLQGKLACFCIRVGVD